jgi:hypothetical protein
VPEIHPLSIYPGQKGSDLLKLKEMRIVAFSYFINLCWKKRGLVHSAKLLIRNDRENSMGYARVRLLLYFINQELQIRNIRLI